MARQRKRYNIDDIKTMFYLEGYKLKTDIYKNSQQRLYFMCPNGHHMPIYGSSMEQRIENMWNAKKKR